MKGFRRFVASILAMVMLVASVVVINTTSSKAAQLTILPDTASGMVRYCTHVQDYGWLKWVSDGAMSGTSGESKRLESIAIELDPSISGGIEYSTHIQNRGWTNFVANGAQSGSTGSSLRLEGIKIRLTGDAAKKYDVYYKVHVQNVGWMDWVKNGEMAGTTGRSLRLEGIYIKLVEKPEISVNYRTHVQNVGWQGYVRNGEMSGTSGRSLRLEGININLENNTGISGGIRYKTHIQNIGWESAWASNNSMSGTSGRSLRLEAISIELTGDIANYYDVYYQVHVQDAGWLDWAKNGAYAGSEGYSRRLEGIRIQLVKKGQPLTNKYEVKSAYTGIPYIKKAASSTPATLSKEDQYRYDVVSLVNADRAKVGAKALKADPELMRLAQIRAKEQAVLYSHTRPDGRSCFTVMSDNNYKSWSSGENIAYGYSTPTAVNTGWYNSQGHRENMLNKSFTAIGVGYYYANGRAYWVELFANPY